MKALTLCLNFTLKFEVKISKTSSAFCTLPKVNLCIEFKVSKLMNSDTFSKKDILDQIVYFKEWKIIKYYTKDIISTYKEYINDCNLI